VRPEHRTPQKNFFLRLHFAASIAASIAVSGCRFYCRLAAKNPTLYLYAGEGECMANQYTPRGICTICGRRLSAYNPGTKCFFHSVIDRSQNLLPEEHYHPVKYVDPENGSLKVRISEGGAWRQSANRING